jgi:hypothetical protein
LAHFKIILWSVTISPHIYMTITRQTSELVKKVWNTTKLPFNLFPKLSSSSLFFSISHFFILASHENVKVYFLFESFFFSSIHSRTWGGGGGGEWRAGKCDKWVCALGNSLYDQLKCDFVVPPPSKSVIKFVAARWIIKVSEIIGRCGREIIYF